MVVGDAPIQQVQPQLGQTFKLPEQAPERGEVLMMPSRRQSSADERAGV